MQVRQDKYTLTKSPTVQILKTGEDIKVDLKLSVNTKFENIGAVISGAVLDISNTPIKGAVVKLMDDKLQPLTYTETDMLGKYFINNIPLSVGYSMVAAATGKLLTPTTKFTLSKGEAKTVNFTLSDDPNALLGAINGTILNSSNTPIFGAVIFLYNLSSATPKLEAITYTDSLGGFILSELLPGNYEITVSALGYSSSKISSSVEKGKISNVSKILSASNITSTGIISGVISNDSNVPIADADVILYQVTTNNTLLPVAYTTTNSSGVYTFINIPIGSYLIKSTQSEVINVNSALSTSTLPSNEYDLALGSLENNAIIDSSTNLVSNLGGIDDGSSTIIITTDTEGEYTLSIEYLSADSDRFLSLDINEINTGTIYSFPVTNSWTIDDIKLSSITVNLISGKNILKFHGNGSNYAPNLGKVIVSKITTPNSVISNDSLMNYDISLGTLNNGAFVDSLTNFASSLGGPSDGSSTITVNVSSQSSYNLLIEYLCTDTNNILSVDVNDINTGISYTLTPTKDLTLNSVENFILYLNLKEGANTIKFHGNGVNYAPNLGKLTLSQSTTVTSTNSSTNTIPKFPTSATSNYNALDGLLENGALLENLKDGKIVGWLGGPKDGSVTIGVNVANSGEYNLGIKYVCAEDRDFKIDINNENTKLIYTAPKTKTWIIADANIFTLPITLKSGNNLIKFHGDGTNYAPSILNLNLSNPTTSSIPIINIYRKTSLTPGNAIERKKFNIPFHTLEPLGIEVMFPTTINVLIKGTNIKGTGDVNFHDVNNIRYIATLTVNQVKTIFIPKKGELFLKVDNISSTLSDSTPFAFQVIININNDVNYIITPTFDIRSDKIFNKTITDENEYNKALLANSENGMLAISENARLYFPKCKFVPSPISPTKVLALHEQTISEHNKLAGLNINAPNELDKPRKNFVLVSARNEQGGYMSAGGTMLDTHPTSSGAYFSAGWGMFHEYGHLYEQGWSFIEMWNNMYSANMAKQTTGFTWLWGKDRLAYENKNIETFYKDYLVNGNFIERGFGFGTGLYFFISLQDFFGMTFVATLTNYYRNNNIPFSKHNYVVYAIAKNYNINIIPYMEMYGYYEYDNEVINAVIDSSTSSFIYIPINPNFSKYLSISTPPIVKTIYAGTNQILVGIANPNAQIKLTVNNNTYTTTCNEKSKFSITIPENIDETSVLKISSTEPNKTISVTKTIKVKTLLSDNIFSFYGLGNALIATLGFDATTKTLTVKSTGSTSHSYFNTSYFGASLYDNNGNLIATSSVTGKENANAFSKVLNGKNFNYGHYIKITHAEPSRLNLSGRMLNAPNPSSPFTFKSINLSKVTFYIRNNGIEYKFI